MEEKSLTGHMGSERLACALKLK